MYLVAVLSEWAWAGYPKNASRVASLHSQASSLGHLHSLTKLGVCYEYSVGVERDPKEARRLYLMAAERGCVEACCRVAHCFRKPMTARFILSCTLLPTRRCKLHGNRARPCVSDGRSSWSRWTPTPEVHQFVPLRVHQAMLSWSLVARRTVVPKDLHTKITCYISTRNGW